MLVINRSLMRFNSIGHRGLCWFGGKFIMRWCIQGGSSFYWTLHLFRMHFEVYFPRRYGESDEQFAMRTGVM